MLGYILMKILITILLFPLFSHAQQWYVPTSNDAVITGLSFISGSANGLEETIKILKIKTTCH